ncbi:MAG: amidohydrolase family protein [Chloroflexota bacterium]
MTDFDLVVRNGTVVTSNRRREVDIGVIDGRIASISRRGGLSGTGDEEIDATGHYVLPGVIDGHVQFREPGMEYKEDWMTGSRAAVMGGVTTVLDMPNTIPQTSTPEGARVKQGPSRAWSSASRLSLASPSVAFRHRMTARCSTACAPSRALACASGSTPRTTT